MANKTFRQRQRQMQRQRGKTLRKRNNTQRRARKTMKSQRRKTQRGRGILDYFKRKGPQTQELGKSTYTNTIGRIPGVGASVRFLNRTGKNLLKFNPNTLGSISSKLNALLIQLQVPYVFSDGTLATDYKLSLENVGNATNEGRGYTPALKRAYNAIGFASNIGKLYNLGDNILGTQDAQIKYKEYVPAPFSSDFARGSPNSVLYNMGIANAPTVAGNFGTNRDFEEEKNRVKREGLESQILEKQNQERVNQERLNQERQAQYNRANTYPSPY